MDTLSSRLLSHFWASSMQHVTQAIPPASLFYCCLQRDLQAALMRCNQNYKTHLSLSVEAQEELTWWQEQLLNWNGKPLRQAIC